MKRRGRLTLGLGLLALLLILLLAWTLGRDWRAIPGEALTAFHLDPRPLAGAYILQTLGWLLVVDTWRRILGPEAAAVPFARHLRAHTLAGMAQVVPGSIWAPLSRVALYRQEGIGAARVSAGLAVELMLIGLAGLALYGLAAPFAAAAPPEWAPLLGLAAIAALVLLHPRAFGPLMRFVWRRLGREDEPAVPDAATLLRFFLRELMVLLLSGLAFYLLMLGISPAASLPEAIGVWGFTVALANLLAWLPATSLLKDGGMAVLLTPLYAAAMGDLGSGVLVAAGVTLAWRIWSLSVLASWALLAQLLDRFAGPGLPNGIDEPGELEHA